MGIKAATIHSSLSPKHPKISSPLPHQDRPSISQFNQANHQQESSLNKVSKSSSLVMVNLIESYEY